MGKEVLDAYPGDSSDGSHSHGFLSDAPFLQSSHWETFQKSCGKTVFRIGGVLLVENRIPILGKYWYAPRAPIHLFSKDWEEIRTEALRRGISWIRTEPFDDTALYAMRGAFPENQVVPSHDIQPRRTLGIDISVPEERILARMKPKTRYNIRHCLGKKEVSIYTSNDSRLIGRFYELASETVARAGIRAHSVDHYKALLESLPEEIVDLYCCEYVGKIIAMNIVIFYDKTAIYLHGASGNEHRNIMAPYALQWRAILDAKNRGCQWYDFGGVSDDNTRDKWAGITRFKTGFDPSAKPKVFPGAFDIVLKPFAYESYGRARSLAKIRTIFRGFSGR